MFKEKGKGGNVRKEKKCLLTVMASALASAFAGAGGCGGCG